MARIKALYESVAAQYAGGIKTVIDKTGRMFRSARTKVIERGGFVEVNNLTNRANFFNTSAARPK